MMLVAFGLTAWYRAYQQSIDGFVSPLVGLSLPTGDALPSQTHRVVLIVMSGMSYDTAVSVDMPILQTVRKAGAYAPITCRPPTLWQTAWAGMMAGVDPMDSGLPLLSVSPEANSPIRLDTLLDAARDGGRRTAVVGSSRWSHVLPADAVDVMHLAEGDDVRADAEVVQVALGLIGDPQYDLILVQLSGLETAAQNGGTAGQEYAGATRQMDSHLRQIVRQVNLSNSVLIITSDVGLRDEGSPAGADGRPPDLPLVMAGQNVVVGSFSAIEQADLAPTVAMLLGTRMPSASTGDPQMQFISIEPADEVLGRLLVAAQRVTLQDALALRLDQPSGAEAWLEDLLSARDDWLAGNNVGAVALSELVAHEATQGIAAVREGRLITERRTRLPLALAGLLGPVFLAWSRRVQRRPLHVVSALVAVGSFYGLYRLTGHEFVFADALGPVGSVPAFVSGASAAAFVAGGLLVTASLVGEGQRRLVDAVGVVNDFALVTVYAAALPLLFLFWQYGGLLHWHMAPAWAVVVMGLSLQQTATVAAAGVGLPWILGGIVWVVNRWRAQRRPSDQDWDPIAYLRRRQ